MAFELKISFSHGITGGAEEKKIDQMKENFYVKFSKNETKISSELGRGKLLHRFSNFVIKIVTQLSFS